MKKGKNGKRRKSPHFSSPISYLCIAGFTRSQASSLLKKGPDAFKSGLLTSVADARKAARNEEAEVTPLERAQRALADEREQVHFYRGKVEGLAQAIRIKSEAEAQS